MSSATGLSMTGTVHAAADDRVGILRTGVEPCLEVCGRRRQNEHADDVGACLLPQLLGALPVDVEQHVASGRQRRFDRRTRRAVAIVEYGSPFEQFREQVQNLE